MKDKSGRVIKAGDFIIYGRTVGRSADMNYGRVLSIGKANVHYGLHKQTVVEFVGLRDFFWKGSWLQQPSRLQDGRRILVVNRKQIPEKAFKHLSKVQS